MFAYVDPNMSSEEAFMRWLEEKDSYVRMPYVSREWMLQIAKMAFPHVEIDLKQIYVVKYNPNLYKYLVHKFLNNELVDHTKPYPAIGDMKYIEEVVDIQMYADRLEKEIHYLGVGIVTKSLVFVQR